MNKKVICVNNSRKEKFLTVGKIYMAEDTWDPKKSTYRIKCDNDSKYFFFTNRFKDFTKKNIG